MYPYKNVESHEKNPAEKRKNVKEAYCLGIESSADDFGVGIATFQTGKSLQTNLTATSPPKAESTQEKPRGITLK